MNKRSLIYLNIAVLLFGLAGLFAKWIDLPSLGITFGRVFFSSLSLPDSSNMERTVSVMMGSGAGSLAASSASSRSSSASTSADSR